MRVDLDADGTAELVELDAAGQLHIDGQAITCRGALTHELIDLDPRDPLMEVWAYAELGDDDWVNCYFTKAGGGVDQLELARTEVDDEGRILDAGTCYSPPGAYRHTAKGFEAVKDAEAVGEFEPGADCCEGPDCP
ncbi:MAG: hypothetical protein SFX73_00615 [Kofleriaceae bacterium]|nr:hypothetical protein [Kofleriaceae bacterium]